MNNLHLQYDFHPKLSKLLYTKISKFFEISKIWGEVGFQIIKRKQNLPVMLQNISLPKIHKADIKLERTTVG